ncbi:MAG: hypothetical protein FJ290_16400 [Planctomycetes bacterium]|nr:hypothetical protein [Planctomycetota bacterium]
MTREERRRYREWAEKAVREAPRYERACLAALAVHNLEKKGDWHRLSGGGCDARDPDEENGLVILQRKFMIVAARILMMYREGKL